MRGGSSRSRFLASSLTSAYLVRSLRTPYAPPRNSKLASPYRGSGLAVCGSVVVGAVVAVRPAVAVGAGAGGGAVVAGAGAVVAGAVVAGAGAVVAGGAVCAITASFTDDTSTSNSRRSPPIGSLPPVGRPVGPILALFCVPLTSTRWPTNALNASSRPPVISNASPELALEQSVLTLVGADPGVTRVALMSTYSSPSPRPVCSRPPRLRLCCRR